MKKFSNITNNKVGTQPIIKETKEDYETDLIRAAILNLIDSNLKIESYGSYKVIINQTSKIKGKELLVESLIDLIQEKSIMDQIKKLNSLKAKNTDWVSIDESIDELSTELSNNTLKPHITKINNMISKYGSDIDNFKVVLESSINKMKNAEYAYNRYLAACEISNKKSSDFINLIKEGFLNKSKELGYGT